MHARLKSVFRRPPCFGVSWTSSYKSYSTPCAGWFHLDHYTLFIEAVGELLACAEMAAARTSFEPALARLETLRGQALAANDEPKVAALDAERDALLERMHPGLSKMTPCQNCKRRGHAADQCPRPKHWRQLRAKAEARGRSDD